MDNHEEEIQRAGAPSALNVGLAARWTDNDIAEAIEQAHMAGQINQGHCDPSAYEAMVYRRRVMAANVELTSPPTSASTTEK